MNGKPYSHHPKPTPLEAATTRITELEAEIAEQKGLIKQMVEAVKQDRIEWEDFSPSSLLAFSKMIAAIQAEGKQA